MKRVLIGVLIAYKRFISPLLPRSCRFTPTCSEYARLAILEHGAIRGSWLTLGRLFRCQPFHPGGIDLPPS
ncbi:MAG: membrane protein insertion efficiency factor YidD [Acidobacteriota bacterium]